MILDDATKEPPADPDAVFVPELPYGSNRVSVPPGGAHVPRPAQQPDRASPSPEGDPTLLGQAPARPDRMHAAHWALLASTAPEARTLGPQAQLASVYSRHTPTLQPATAWKNSTRWHAPAISGMQSWPAPSIN
ncbi:hypothetical protein ACFQV4_30745 [Streptomyces thermocarboxydus]